MKFWNFLNGKKTLIGATFLLASCVCSELIVGVWDYNPDWMQKLIQSLDWAGMGLTSVGFIHKGSKNVRQNL